MTLNSDHHEEPVSVAGRAPLRALLGLVQDREVRLEQTGPALAVADMLSNAPVVSADPGRAAALLGRCQQILRTVPYYRLHFLPDDSFWRVVDDELGARIWQLADGRRPLGDIVAVICAEYAVEPAPAQADVLEFAAELERKGVVRLSP